MTEKTVDRLFRKAVLHNNGPRCQACGTIDVPLEVHHIYSRGFDLIRWDLGNGMVLCKDCHGWAHNSGFVKGLRAALPKIVRDRLETQKKVFLFEYLAKNEMTKEEFMEDTARFLILFNKEGVL